MAEESPNLSNKLADTKPSIGNDLDTSCENQADSKEELEEGGTIETDGEFDKQMKEKNCVLSAFEVHKKWKGTWKLGMQRFVAVIRVMEIKSELGKVGIYWQSRGESGQVQIAVQPDDQWERGEKENSGQARTVGLQWIFNDVAFDGVLELDCTTPLIEAKTSFWKGAGADGNLSLRPV